LLPDDVHVKNCQKYLPDDVSDVLDDHLVRADVLAREEAPVVNGRLAEGELLSPELRTQTRKNAESRSQAKKMTSHGRLF
jgi:hypothetical protein